MSMRSKEQQEFKTMGWALGIPDSGRLMHKEQALVVDPDEPLDKLLLNKRFLQSFMAFADRCQLITCILNFDPLHTSFLNINSIFLEAVWPGRVCISMKKCNSMIKSPLLIL